MGKLDRHMFIVAVCEQFGWTYEQYWDQPVHFLELIRGKLECDNKEKAMALRKSKRG